MIRQTIAMLLMLGAATAQQRPTLTSLDQRLTTLEQAPTPEQLATKRWFPARSGITLQIGGTPSGLTFDGAHLWVADTMNNTLVKVDASDGPILGRFAAHEPLSGPLAFDGVAIWAGLRNSQGVLKLRAGDGAVIYQIFLDRDTAALVFDGANIWLAHPDGYVTEIHVGNSTHHTIPVPGVNHGITFDGTALWTVGADGNGWKVAPSGAFYFGFGNGSPMAGIAFDGSAIWVTRSSSNQVLKLRASDGSQLGLFSVGHNPGPIVFDGTSIWVANTNDNTVTRLRAADGANLGTFATGLSPVDLAFDGVNIWVANSGDGTVSKL